ncbi:Abi family protein [Enterococcus cecorum]|uniref:Abi family protein n=1 Tax=Enterococcus cecorum TaxID=44008 RepID=UPI003F919A49
MEHYQRHPYKTFDEQIDYLEKEKKLIINNKEFAKEALMSISYYSLINGYKDLFLKKDIAKEIFNDGTTFEMLYQIHWIDLSMSNLLFKYTLFVEKKLKINVADIIAKNYSIQEDYYLDKRNYSSSKGKRGKYLDVCDAIEKAKQKDISAMHYVKKEQNVPPWIAAKAISFGSMVNWYSILKDEDKKNVVNNLFKFLSNFKKEDKFDFAIRVIGQVYEYRNISAHGNRNYLIQLPEKTKLLVSHSRMLNFDSEMVRSNNKGYYDCNLFSVMVSIILIINDNYVITNFISDIHSFLSQFDRPQYNFVGKSIYDLFDLPKDTVNRLKNIYYAVHHTKILDFKQK